MRERAFADWALSSALAFASLFPDRREHLRERSGRGAKDASVGLAQIQDQVERRGYRQRAYDRDHDRRRIALRREPEADEDESKPNDNRLDKRKGDGRPEPEGGARYRAGGWYAPAGVDLAAFGERGWL